MPHSHTTPDNVLLRHFGGIPSAEEIQQKLTVVPEIRPDILDLPRHVRLRELRKIDRLHLPFDEDVSLHNAVDEHLRRRYEEDDPAMAETWSRVGSEMLKFSKPPRPAGIIAVEGPPGSGKTQAIGHSLASYPSVIRHETFPKVVGPCDQLVSLSGDVAGSGTLVDVTAGLMRVYQTVMETMRFQEALARQRPNGPAMFAELVQVLKSNFTGVLHLDEVQNFFKIPAKSERLKKSNAHPELRIVEDLALRSILNFANESGIVLVLSGTPDGMRAIDMRLSIVERTLVGGRVQFSLFQDPKSFAFRHLFVQKLIQYQYVRDKIVREDAIDALAAKLIQLTTGSKRMILVLWLAAHRVAYERHNKHSNEVDDLTLQDFEIAAQRYLAAAAPAIMAFRSRDPALMSNYLDLAVNEDAYWARQWATISSM